MLNAQFKEVNNNGRASEEDHRCRGQEQEGQELAYLINQEGPLFVFATKAGAL